MKLLSLNIIDADTCGGLLNGVRIRFRDGKLAPSDFSPLCLIGPNGSGKSQVLQIVAEIFHAAFAKYLPEEEQGTPNNQILFELEYGIFDKNEVFQKVRISRQRIDKKSEIRFEKHICGDWTLLAESTDVAQLLPSKVIGYTSGDNETLSIPFFVSRAGYAEVVRTNAFDPEKTSQTILDSRMLLIDYSTNLEVLIANLLLNPANVREHLVREPNLKRLRSFRCVVQLKYGSGANKKVRLTEELASYIEHLKSSATCFQYDKKAFSYTFDFFVQNATHQSFSHHWNGGALSLYSCFHKLAMLNDLIIPKADRDAFKRGVRERRFASRLPEPMEREKVFRFERVEFVSQKNNQTVDYVSLSDGEHQLTQLLGTLCMVAFPNALFLLDEPESHFNPTWRVEFISKLMGLPTQSEDACVNEGRRTGSQMSARQDCLITTHSPFVPSDMQSDNVLIFKKDQDGGLNVSKPNIQTYGSTFDTILEECFNISPPMSEMPRAEIEKLLESDDVEKIKEAISRLGDSVKRIHLADRVRMLKAKGV